MQTQTRAPSKTGGLPGQELYAIAVEIFVKGELTAAKMSYVHAYNEQDARVRFRHAYPNANKYRIVAIAKPIGYWANDSSGENLSVN